jgi:hypothetical protein
MVAGAGRLDALAALQGWSQGTIRGEAGLRAETALAGEAGLTLRMEGRPSWEMWLRGMTQGAVTGAGQAKGRVGMQGEIGLSVRVFAWVLGGNHVLVALQTIDAGPLVVAGELVEWEQ